MPEPATADEFIDLIRKSGLVDGARLDAWIKAAARDAMTELKALAGGLIRDGLLTDYQAEYLLRGEWNRFQIGRFRILERLGAGPMGRVYLCDDKHIRQTVAVKIIRQSYFARNAPEAQERFLREARCMAALQHSNIVAIYEVGQLNNVVYIGLEFVDGLSLRRLVHNNGLLSPVRAAHYVGQSAAGLQYAHESGLFHRDVEPGNILIDRQGTVKLIDFGLAFLMGLDQPASSELKPSQLVTDGLLEPDYAAPETAFGQTLDHRADIYSLGATFYFCLAGPPVPEGTVEQKLQWLQTTPPVPIRSLRPEVPPAMAAVIERMMAKDPAERYPTMQAVADALAPWTCMRISPPAEHELPQWSPAALAVIRRGI